MKKIYLPIVLFFYVHVAIADSQRQLDSLQTRMSYLKKQRTIDSLHTSLKNEKQEIEIVNTLLELASIFRDGSPDSAMVFGNDAYQLAEKVNYQMGIGRSFHLIATIFGMKEDNNNALLYFSKALAVYDKMDNDTQKYPHEKVQAQKAKSLANIGMVYKAMKNYDKALDYFFIAHKIEEEIRNKAGVARNLGNIGDVYCDKQDYNKAFEYELRGLDIYKKLADKNGIATITGFIGRIYVAIKEYPKAEKYLLEA